ncbi:MAG: GNAT family N-acetyltransferase [Clostridiales bacterium]|nr:GNAT family N-acetyltransferase [Clostridiales bacterium]
MVIETERLILRQMTRDDFGSLYKVLADPSIMEHYPYSFDEKRVMGWIDRNIERYETFGFGLWAVCLKDSGEMIGDCGLTMQIIHDQIRPEIGYHIRADQQHKGYAKEASRAVRDWTFKNLPFNRIYSYMKYTNIPSSRTAMSYGCRFIEEFEDDVNEKTRVYAITRDEWKELTRKK